MLSNQAYKRRNNKYRREGIRTEYEPVVPLISLVVSPLCQRYAYGGEPPVTFTSTIPFAHVVHKGGVDENVIPKGSE
jgi:hypothetical protein